LQQSIAASNKRLEWTRHESALLLSNLGEPLKRSVRSLGFEESMSIFRTIEFSQEWLDIGIIVSEKLQETLLAWIVDTLSRNGNRYIEIVVQPKPDRIGINRTFPDLAHLRNTGLTYLLLAFHITFISEVERAVHVLKS